MDTADVSQAQFCFSCSRKWIAILADKSCVRLPRKSIVFDEKWDVTPPNARKDFKGVSRRLRQPTATLKGFAYIVKYR